MSSIPFDPGPMGRAEKRFREAFDRLKCGRPIHLPKGTRVTQNNVAKEAGVDPSALRPKRYPRLVAEIQEWIEANRDNSSAKSPRQIALARRSRNRDLKEQNAALRAQRDDALSRLVDAEATILEVVAENQRLRAQQPQTNVTPLRPAHAGGSRSGTT